MLKKTSFRHLKKLLKFKNTKQLEKYGFECRTRQCSTNRRDSKSDLKESTKLFFEKNINKLGCQDISLDGFNYKTFITMFPQMVKESLIESIEDEMLIVSQNFEKVSNNIIGTNRDFYVAPNLLKACKAFSEPKKESAESVRLECILAWCFEMEATGGVLLDDLLDNEIMRWGKPCFHNINGVGTTINTATLIRTSGRQLLKKFFKNHPLYNSFLNIMCDMTFKTSIGQLLDVNTSHRFKKYRNADLISMKKYLLITKYKSSYFQFKSPVLAAMYLHNKHQKEFTKIENVLDKLSLHLQTANDMWDCYGKYESFRRVGTDVSEGKCTWLAATAVECMNIKQKELFRQHYGKDEQESQNIIKRIYDDIKIPKKYTENTLHKKDELIKELQRTDDLEIRSLLQSFVNTYIDLET